MRRCRCLHLCPLPLSVKLIIKWPMNYVDSFVKQVKARCSENSEAFELLYDAQKYGVAIGLLRQELDTLIRLSYLLHEDTSKDVGFKLIDKSVNGKPWKRLNHNGKEVRLLDRSMLELASHLGGWEQIVYSFGCKLIHLSGYHLYKKRDPFNDIKEKEKNEIISYLEKYHSYPHGEINFTLLVPYLPKIWGKISSNNDSYLEDLTLKYVE